MERAVECFVMVTALVVGLSHILQARAWAALYAGLARQGAAGAFANGALHLGTGAAIVAGHGHVWSAPAAALTVLGWALVLKGAVCFLAPGWALRSMAAGGAGRGRGFVAAGALLVALGGVLAYVLWAG
jgi:hypothetical protein